MAHGEPSGILLSKVPRTNPSDIHVVVWAEVGALHNSSQVPDKTEKETRV